MLNLSKTSTMPKKRILIIDDNIDLLRSLELLLKTENHQTITISEPGKIENQLVNHDFDAIMLDMNFQSGSTSGTEGLKWLETIKQKDATIPVIMITAYGDIELAVKATKSGAFDFIQKPWNVEKLLSTLNAAFKYHESLCEVEMLKMSNKALEKESQSYSDDFIGESRAIRKLKETISKIAPTDANILILGENGTGKDLVAREIHKLSVSRDKQFISVDLGSLQEQLFESELFGHSKGAFTDAISDQVGRLELAINGTLFLDEIGNLPLHLQPKLLSALQSKSIRRLGCNKLREINFRLICATNSNIPVMVKDRYFREDLYYRINTVEIEVPPLRERGKDTLLLAEYFLEKFRKKYKKANLEIEDNAVQKLLNYSWPGNVRELKHAIERAVILSEDTFLSESALQLNIHEQSEGFLVKTLNLESIEEQVIKEALVRSSGNLSKVARELGVSRTTLYKKLEKYGL